MGIHGTDNRNGQAAIWLDSYREKEESFNVIRSLKIKDFLGKEADPFIHFSKTAQTNDLANFRRGDISRFISIEKRAGSPFARTGL